jgi:hypothetical protein
VAAAALLSLAWDEGRGDGDGGALHGVRRPGAIPRGKLARTGRSPLPSRLPKVLVLRAVESFRVGFVPVEKAGNPAGKCVAKLALKVTACSGAWRVLRQHTGAFKVSDITTAIVLDRTILYT